MYKRYPAGLINSYVDLKAIFKFEQRILGRKGGQLGKYQSIVEQGMQI